jgi:hypothetical protein
VNTNAAPWLNPPDFWTLQQLAVDAHTGSHNDEMDWNKDTRSVVI